jgi:hypothetical protein
MIGVPSKGRAGRSQTLAAVLGQGIDVPGHEVWIVCPAIEINAYRDAYPWVTYIWPQDGPGIGSARQTLLRHAREIGTGPFWMLDDDITSTSVKLVGGPMGKVALPHFLSMLDSVLVPYLNEKIALAGPNFRHRAWTDPYGVHMDVHLRNFIRVNPAAPIDYWPHLKEDLDVVLQALMAGWHTVLFNQFVFDSPQMGTSAGGCRDDYDAGLLDEACRALVEKWPGVVSLRITEEAQLTNRVDWREVRRRQEAIA